MKTITRLLLFFVICNPINIACKHETSGSNKEINLNMTEYDEFELALETAHPNAQELMNDAFYWDIVDENAPFGNDAGSDAFSQFRNWRKFNPTASPVDFVNQLLESWDYPVLDLSELDSNKIRQYIETNHFDSNFTEAANIVKHHLRQASKNSGTDFDDAEAEIILQIVMRNMGSAFLTDTDNAIIAIGLGQFILEGKIDNDIRKAAKFAITRELMPEIVEGWGDYKSQRVERLTKIFGVLDASI
ncbi:hypothetical protein [Dyadobacter psychrotolerans]|uniref:Uncharacterized protein n=1 Tax=Dyadobacter psychrotolerans TaxID=2541721 RepID=A0A4R5DF88_9BACT|nr:hypothetical protein [Dyadobacter psychrotolerans]TDE09033.1 hypothetical protein E0F88_31620 [Dyadobacter psychrotolerans]